MGPGQEPDDFELSGSGDLGMEGEVGWPGLGAVWMAGSAASPPRRGTTPEAFDFCGDVPGVPLLPQISGNKSNWISRFHPRDPSWASCCNY